MVAFNSLCHFASLKEQDKTRLFRITKTASRLIGRPVADLQAHFEVKAIKRLEAIQCDPTRPLNKELQAHTSVRSGRLTSFQAKTNQFHSSFLPAAVHPSIIIIIIINPLTARVVGAPQMILLPVFSIFPCPISLPNSRPVNSLMLSSHLFLCLPCLLPPFTVPCKMVLARPDEWET